MKLTDAQIAFLREVEIGRVGLATREADRVRQKLRNAGLVEFDRATWMWRITPAGRAALSSLSKKG